MPFTFKVGAKIKEAWVLYKEHFGAMILIVLVSGILQGISQYYSKQNSNLPINILLIIAGVMVSYIWIKSIMNLLDGKGFNPFSKETLPTLSSFWDFIKTNILITLCVAPLFALAGLIILFAVISSYYISSIYSIVVIIASVLVLLLVIPGLYLIGRLFPAIYLSIEKSQGARNSIKEAWSITKGIAWSIIGKSILIGLFIILGFVALFVGAIITYPLGMIVIVMMYREIMKSKTITHLNPEVIAVPEVPKQEINAEIKVEEKIADVQVTKEGELKEEVK